MTLYSLGRLMEARSRKSEAVKLYEKLLEKQPDNKAAKNRLDALRSGP